MHVTFWCSAAAVYWPTKYQLITALFGWLFRFYFPASEAPSHTVPVITSAYSTNLLLPYTQSDRLRPQKFNKSQSFVLV